MISPPDSTPEKTAPNLHSVLIVTDNTLEARHVVGHLLSIGYDTQTVVFDGNEFDEVPKMTPSAILCLFTDYIELLHEITGDIRKLFSTKACPVIAALSRPGNLNNELFDSVIFPPAHPSQIANRVNSLIRLQEMEREINLRTETLSLDFDIQHKLSENQLNKPYKILFIGKASPEFIVIVNALQKRRVEVIAAFTSFSAFDYLHEGAFDAVVMNVLEGSEPALTITSTMRRNSKLYHIPTLFLVDETTFSEHSAAFESGAKDIISAEASAQEISGRIMELANYHRIHTQLKQEFDALGGELCTDSLSGLFNSTFFEKHIARVCTYYQSTDIPVSLIIVKTSLAESIDIATDKIDRANIQIGGILKNLVRMQDIVARLEPNIYIIAIPGMPHDRIGGVIDRISGIVDCAAFETGLTSPRAFSMSLETATVELMSHETSDMLMGRLMAKLSTESRTLTPTTFEPNAA